MSGRSRVLVGAVAVALVGAGVAALVIRRTDDTAGGSTAVSSSTIAIVGALPGPIATTSTEVSDTDAPATSTTIYVPPPTDPAPVSASCPPTGHAAVVDREAQRAWLCDGGLQTQVFPITSAISMPDPATYEVYAKDMNTTSTFGGHFSRMTHFVAFTHGERTGARIAFHSVPTLNSGEYVQPLDSVGELARRGESSGCIRVLPDDAVTIWDWLSVGDMVVVVS